MRGPLDAAIYDTARSVPSWWEESAPPAPPRPPLTGETTADVAIIGAGFTGLACARALAERGIGAVALDAGEIGWGSSGRAGGIVGYGGSKLGRAALVRRFGEAEVARSERMLAGQMRALRAFCEENGLADAVQGDGEIVYAHSARAAAALRAETAPAGAEAEEVAPSGLDDIARFGGVRIRPCFGVHPLRLARGMADAAEAAGARLHGRSEVLAWERAGNGHRLVTAGGAVRAARVVLATNAFTPDRLHPRLGARAIPVLSNIGVTRPLTDDERARHPWLGAEPMADTRNLLAYFRLLPEGRLLYGMRGDMRGSEAGAVRMRARLEARLGRDLPGFAGVPLTHFWRGPVCATLSLRPAIGRLGDEPTVLHGFGWHGSGIAMGSLAGRLLAGLAAGEPDDSVPAPWRGLPPAVPLPGLRPLYVGAMMTLYGLADRQG
jgi:glycine/D-amino acid oxidase-like deaminating enzyme